MYSCSNRSSLPSRYYSRPASTCRPQGKRANPRPTHSTRRVGHRSRETCRGWRSARSGWEDPCASSIGARAGCLPKSRHETQPVTSNSGRGGPVLGKLLGHACGSAEKPRRTALLRSRFAPLRRFSRASKRWNECFEGIFVVKPLLESHCPSHSIGGKHASTHPALRAHHST